MRSLSPSELGISSTSILKRALWGIHVAEGFMNLALLSLGREVITLLKLVEISRPQQRKKEVVKEWQIKLLKLEDEVF
jgi:hypothetical protein